MNNNHEMLSVVNSIEDLIQHINERQKSIRKYNLGKKKVSNFQLGEGYVLSEIKQYLEHLEKREETHKHLIPNLQSWKDRHSVTITELEKQLENYLKLQKEVQLGIERVWSIDSYDYSTNPYDVKERSEIIEQVFYKIGKKWID